MQIKKLFLILFSTLMILTLSACKKSASSNGPADNTKQQLSIMKQTEKETLDGTERSGKNILVVYFSWSGHLDSMAHWVADETGGNLYRVNAKVPYPDNFDQTADRAKREQDKSERPEIVIDVTKEQMAQYDTVFIGFPVWWYDLPMPMWTFLESYDFSGKTIIPFFSHEGSSNGARALPTIERLALGATVRRTDALSIRGGNVDKSEKDVRTWIQGLGI